jgi:beta-1,3-galactosyltransferase 1/2/3/4/5/7/8
VQLPSGKKVEAHHSPAAFIESAIQPDGSEQLRRKDAIILRRNAELVSILEEFKTKIPWRKAEAAAAAEENRLTALGSLGDENANNRLLALILVHSEPKDHRFRTLARKTWAPSTPAAVQDLRDKLNIAIKFITIMPGGASLQEPLRQEQAQFQDLLIIEEDNVEGSDAKKVLAAVSLAIDDENLDSDFYVVTRDTIVVDVNAISGILDGKKTQGNLYMGCMKSGDVVSNILSQWDEPDSDRFGVRSEGGSAYPVHATKEFYVLSRYLGRYLARARSVLHSYKFEDTTMGAWLVGLEVSYIDDGKLCCSPSDPCRQAGPRCIAYYDSKCSGLCEPETEMEKLYNECIGGKS